MAAMMAKAKRSRFIMAAQSHRITSRLKQPAYNTINRYTNIFWNNPSLGLGFNKYCKSMKVYIKYENIFGN